MTVTPSSSRNVLSYLTSRSRLAFQLAISLPTARRQCRPTRSWDDLITFVFEFADGFLAPLQIRSEIRAALEIIESVKPRRILEIGTARGGTFFLLSRAAAGDAVLFSIDLPAGRWGGGYANWKIPVFRRLLLPGQAAHFIRDDSHANAVVEQVKALLKGEPLDLLFIDGDHSYDGVKMDFDLYRPLVRPGGLIVFHDIAHHPPEKQCEVDRFWAEISPRYSSQEIIADPRQGGFGIGILRC